MKMSLKYVAIVTMLLVGSSLIAGCTGSSDPNSATTQTYSAHQTTSEGTSQKATHVDTQRAQSRPSDALDTGKSFDYALANSQIRAHLTRPSTYRVQSHSRNGSTDVVRFTYKNSYGEELRGRAFFVNMELVKLEQL